MLRILSSNAQKAKNYENHFNPVMLVILGIHWKALAEYYQMSTHLPWFQTFLKFLSFHVDQISNQQQEA